MISRTLALAGGFAGAAGLSQYPEFSQQYLQRLAGQVEALEVVVEDFDQTATRSGLDRDAALEQMGGNSFLVDRQADMRRAIQRYDGLADDLDTLKNTSPVKRMLMPYRHADRETFAGAWADFEPAMPLTLAGFVTSMLGFFAGFFLIGVLLRMIVWSFRRRAG